MTYSNLKPCPGHLYDGPKCPGCAHDQAYAAAIEDVVKIIRHGGWGISDDGFTLIKRIKALLHEAKPNLSKGAAK